MAAGGGAGLDAARSLGTCRSRRRAHSLWSARTRRSRVPRRREVGIGAHCGRRTPLRSRQRSRGRACDVQGPHADAPRSVSGDRGSRDRGAHRRGRRGVLRHQAEVRARSLRAPARGARDGRDRDARRLEGLDRRRTRRVPLRRGEGAPRGDRGTRSAADAASSVPAGLVRHGAARVGGRCQRGTRRPEQPDPRQQRRDARHGGAHPREGRVVVSIDGHGGLSRHRHRHDRRRCRAQPGARGRARHSAVSRARRVWWPASRGAGSSPRSQACRTRCWPRRASTRR